MQATVSSLNKPHCRPDPSFNKPHCPLYHFFRTFLPNYFFFRRLLPISQRTSDIEACWRSSSYSNTPKEWGHWLRLRHWIKGVMVRKRIQIIIRFMMGVKRKDNLSKINIRPEQTSQSVKASWALRGSISFKRAAASFITAFPQQLIHRIAGVSACH